MADVGDGGIDYRRFISAVNRTQHGYRSRHWQAERDNTGPALTRSRTTLARPC